MTRVIAGEARGRRLAVPPGTTTRPTSDRAREGLFASLLSELGDLDGKRVLDLYAGSGAVGLEALSRGANHVLLVESDARAAAVIRANIATVGLAGAIVVTNRAEQTLARPLVNDSPFDLVFADPPYALTEAALNRVLTLLTDGWLADGALVVIERATRSGPLDWPPGYLPVKSRRYGEATFWYGSGAEAGQPQETVSQPALDAPHKAHEE
jgi:16S rRNA (guanine966-N2)-methyltransferase